MPEASPNVGADSPPEQSKLAQPVKMSVPPSGQVLVPTYRINPDSAGDVKGVERLDPVRQAGMWLATGVGLLIATVTIMIVIHWMATAPWTGIPANLSGMKTEDAKAAVDNIKNMSDLSADRSIKLFDAIVSRALLPVFTAILGYIFGSRAAAAADRNHT